MASSGFRGHLHAQTQLELRKIIFMVFWLSQEKEVHDHLWLHSESEDSLSYSYLKRKTGSGMKAISSPSNVLYMTDLGQEVTV